MDHFLMGYRGLYKMSRGTEMIGRLSDSMTATVKPRRLGPSILYNTLKCANVLLAIR